MQLRVGKGRGRPWRTVLPAAALVFGSSYARAQASVEDVKAWRLGEPAPAGYHVARKHTLGIVGGSLLAGGYGFSALYGLVFLTECYLPGADGRASDPCHPSPEHRAAPLLFVPVAGPFLTLTNADVRRDGGAVFWFTVFGTLQLAGAGLLAYDLAVPHYGLKRGQGTLASNPPPPRWMLAPAYVRRGPGLVFSGQF